MNIFSEHHDRRTYTIVETIRVYRHKTDWSRGKTDAVRPRSDLVETKTVRHRVQLNRTLVNTVGLLAAYRVYRCHLAGGAI